MIYRSEIDGLRSLAVISVVIFHFFPSIMPFGYLGVDIFFVISGYLITSHFFFSKIENIQGSAFASFIQKKNIHSYSLHKRLALSFSIDFMVNKNLLPIPNYIKIDVDGNEYEVIKGSLKTLNSSYCKSILIENYRQKFIEKILKSLSFFISSQSQYNTIYKKKI